MPLAVAVTGDISNFAKAMAAASTIAAKAAQGMAEDFIASKLKIDKAFSTIGSNLGGLAIGAGAILAGVAAFGALSEAVRRAREALEDFLKVGRGAEAAGVSAGFFQRMTDQARELGVEAKTITGILEKMREASTVRLGQDGKDNTSEILERLRKHVEAGNIQQTFVDKFIAAPGQEQRIKLIADEIDRLRANTKEVAAFDLAKTFGGAEFEKQVRNGVALTDALREAGTTIRGVRFPDELVAQAQEVDRQLAAAERTMREGWLPITRDIAAWQLSQLQSQAQFNQLVADLVGIVGRVYEGLTSWGSKLTELGNHPFWRRLADMLPRTGSVEDAPPGGFPVPGIKTPAITSPGDTSKGLPGSPKAAAAAAAEQKTALDRFIDQQKKSNAEAQTQAELIGASNLEYKIALALAQARVAAERDFTDKKRDQKALTETEIANVTHLAQVQEKARESVRQTIALQQFAGQTLVSALDKATDSGAKLGDVMLDVAKAIKTAAIQALIMGQGPLAGLFGTGGGQTGQAGPGSLVGLISAGIKAIPKYAEGGVVPGSGPQLAMVHGGETIIPRGGALGGGGVSIVQQIDARGAQLGVAEQITAALAANNRALQVTLPSMIRNAQGRGSMR